MKLIVINKGILILLFLLIIFSGCTSSGYYSELNENEFKKKIDAEYQGILLMMKDAEDKGMIYQTELDGKTQKEMSDYLYHEGFMREINSKDGALGEKYTKVITYEGKNLLEKSSAIIIYIGILTVIQIFFMKLSMIIIILIGNGLIQNGNI